jgi:hypothetical protein
VRNFEGFYLGSLKSLGMVGWWAFGWISVFGILVEFMEDALQLKD